MAQGLPSSPGWPLRIVVGAFAELAADGVDGRQVDDVEAHGGDAREGLFSVGEGAVRAGFGGGGAGEEFVPGTEAGADRIDGEDELVGVSDVALVRIAQGEFVEQGVGGVECGGLFGSSPERRTGGARPGAMRHRRLLR